VTVMRHLLPRGSGTGESRQGAEVRPRLLPWWERRLVTPIPDRDHSFVRIFGVRNGNQPVATEVARKLRRVAEEAVPSLQRAAKDAESDLHESPPGEGGDARRAAADAFASDGPSIHFADFGLVDDIQKVLRVRGVELEAARHLDLAAREVCGLVPRQLDEH